MLSITAIGRLGKDPEVRATKSGDTVCSASLASTSKRGGAEVTTWLRLNIWGKRGEAFAQYHSKGDQAIVTGDLSCRPWTDKDGGQRESWEIDVRDWAFSAKPKDHDEYGQRPPQQGPATGKYASSATDDEQDISFSVGGLDMTSKTTWQLIEEYGALIETIDDAETATNDPDVSDEEKADWWEIHASAEARLADWMADDVPSKLAAMVGYASKLDADVVWHKAESKRYSDRARGMGLRSERIRANALTLLDLAGGKVDLEGGRVAKVAERKSEAVIETRPFVPDEWDPEFLRITFALDKTAIKRALKAGQTVEGAELEQRVSRKVQIE